MTKRQTAEKIVDTGRGARTLDHTVKSRALYLLSYRAGGGERPLYLPFRDTFNLI